MECLDCNGLFNCGLFALECRMRLSNDDRLLTDDANVNVNVLHLYSAICIASEALLVNHLYSAPSQGRLRQCRLGFEHDTLCSHSHT